MTSPYRGRVKQQAWQTKRSPVIILQSYHKENICKKPLSEDHRHTVELASESPEVKNRLKAGCSLSQATFAQVCSK